MKKAARIAVNAHRKTMSKVKTFRYEYELEAEIKYEFAKSNSISSYIPIVGSGKNSCILHYNSNNSILNDGDLVLIDAGCEIELYASDITRTYPVNGRFTREQKEIYNTEETFLHRFLILCSSSSSPYDPRDMKTAS